MRFVPLFALVITSPAMAFMEPDSGGWIGAGGGLTVDANTSLAAGAGWQATAGLWFGKHDAVYAFGKYTGVGVTVRQAYLGGDLLTEPMLEVRRGADIVVVTTQLFASVGPAFRAGEVGATMLAGGGLKYRMTPQFGVVARAELGAHVISGTWGFRGNLIVGVELAAPWSGRRE